MRRCLFRYFELTKEPCQFRSHLKLKTIGTDFSTPISLQWNRLCDRQLCTNLNDDVFDLPFNTPKMAQCGSLSYFISGEANLTGSNLFNYLDTGHRLWLMKIEFSTLWFVRKIIFILTYRFVATCDVTRDLCTNV